MNKIDGSTTKSLFELYRAGNFKKLAERARSLLVSHPQELVLYSLLGAACLELGEYDAAGRSYRAALAIKPDFAKVHNSLGIVYLRSGHPEEAIRSFTAAMEKDPLFAEPRFNLGIAFENLQRLRDAAEQFREAVRLDPGYYKACGALAKVCWELGDYDQVAGHFEQALAINRQYLPAHRGLLQFLEQSNRHKQLREALARARNALGAEHALVRFQEGVVAAIEGNDPEARTLLERFDSEPAEALTMHDERMRLTRLTAICDRLDDTAAAMRHAAGANRLSRQLSTKKGIDTRRFLGFVENRRRYFTQDQVAQWRLDGRDSGTEPLGNPGSGQERTQATRATDQPIFIVGFPRSGTTLVDTILRGHPGIEVAEESDAVSTLVNGLSGPSDEHLAALADLSHSDIERLRATYIDTLARHVQMPDTDAKVVDRFALNIIYVGEIHRIFPHAKFILMLRHPADCILSCYMQAFHETSANASFHTLEDAAHLYDQVFHLWRQYTELLDLNVVAVKYEDVVADVEKACRPMLELIGVSWDSRMLDHTQTARNRPFIGTASYNQVIQPLYSRASGRWLRYRAELQPVLPILNPWIERFGYEVPG